MKIEYNVDEAKILELAAANSMNELPSAIVYEARRQAVEVAVKEIRSKLVDTPYYGGKERLFSEVSDCLWKSINEQIKEVVERKFSEKEIENIVARHFEKTFTEWIEKKVFSRLEEVKKDIFIGSSGELEAERNAEEEAHQEEMRNIQDN